MSNQSFFSIVVVFLIVCLFFGYLWLQKKRLSKLSPYFNGTVSRKSLSVIFKGQYQGLDFSVELFPGGRNNSRAYLSISLYRKNSLNLTINKVSMFSNMVEKIGLVQKVRIDDEVFNRDFLILSKDQKGVRNYLNNVEIRNAINKVFDMGFDSMVVNEMSITIEKPDENLSTRVVEPEFITNVMQVLSVVTKGI